MSEELLIVTDTEQLVTTDELLEQLVATEVEVVVETEQEILELVEAELLVEQDTTLEVLDTTEPAEIFDLFVSIPGPRSSARLTGPSFTYNAQGDLVRVDYDDTRYKTFQYAGGELTGVTFFDFDATYQKTLIYSAGRLTEVVQTTL